MTEIGESTAVIAEEQQQEDHWVKVEYTYSNGLPVEGYFYATDGDGIDWAGKLNDQGQVCLSGLPPGNVSVELIPGDEEKELTNIRKAIKQALDGIIEAEKQEAAVKEAGYQKYGPVGYHVAAAKGLWDGAVGLVTFAWDTVKTAAEIEQYLSPAERLGNFLNATYKSYKSGSLTEADWRESLIKNYQEEEFKDLAELLGFDVRTLNEQKIEEIKLLITEAYEVTAFILEDSESHDLFIQFAKDYAAAQSSYEWAEFAGGGIFEIVLTALLLAFTAGIGNVAQAASKVRHVSKLKNLGTLIRKLGKLLKRKKLKKKVSAGVDGEKKVTVELPDDVKLTAKTEKGKQGQGDSATMQDGSVVPDKINMRSADDLMGVEPASPELISAVSKKRDVVIAQPGSEELRMLDYFGAEASVGGVNNTHILLRENPSKAALLEEFLHGTQSKLGITDRLGTSGLGSAETHVKDFMINHQKMLGLSNEDVRILQILRDKGL